MCTTVYVKFNKHENMKLTLQLLTIEVGKIKRKFVVTVFPLLSFIHSGIADLPGQFLFPGNSNKVTQTGEHATSFNKILLPMRSIVGQLRGNLLTESVGLFQLNLVYQLGNCGNYFIC